MITFYYFMARFYLWLARRRPITDEQWHYCMDKSAEWAGKIKAYAEKIDVISDALEEIQKED